MERLDKDVVHEICTNQVVVTLQACVKELVENALDAGATRIEIRLKESGSELLEVSDNGSGIAPDNYEKLATRHATSKIRSYDDISQSLETFGFRGEALAGICAMGEVSVSTRTAAEVSATLLSYDRFGRLSSRLPAAREPGTTVSVRELFKRLPVRHREFLRNAKAQVTATLRFIQAYAVAQPEIVFHVIAEKARGHNSGRATLLSSSGTSRGWLQAAAAVLGDATVSDVEAFELESVSTGWKISGLISTSIGGRRSRDTQLFFVNRRPIEPPKRIAKLINDTYHQYNSRMYPTVILSFSASQEQVDVNVTPDKRTVFLHNEERLMADIQQRLTEIYSNAAASTSGSLTNFGIRRNGSSAAEAGGAAVAETLSPLPLSGPLAVQPIMPPEESASSCKPLDPQPCQSSDGQPHLKFETPEKSLHVVASSAVERGNDTQSFTQAVRMLPAWAKPLNRWQSNDLSANHLHEPLVSRGNRDDTQIDSSIAIPADVDSAVRTGFTVLGTGELGLAETCVTELGVTEFGITEQGVTEVGITEFVIGEQVFAGSSVTQPEETKPGTNDVFADDPGAEMGDGVWGVAELGVTELGVTELGVSEISVTELSVSDYSSWHAASGSSSTPFSAAEFVCNVEASGTALPLPTDGIKTTELVLVPTELPVPGEPSLSHEAIARSDARGADLSWPPPQPIQASVSMAEMMAAASRRRAKVPRSRGTNANMPKVHFPRAFSLSSLRPGQDSKASLAEVATFGTGSKGADVGPDATSFKFDQSCFTQMRVIGQFNLGFIITSLRTQTQDDDQASNRTEGLQLFIVDQHASDEKFRFEGLNRDSKIDRQPLVSPHYLQLTPAQEQLANAHLRVFSLNGFELHMDEERAPGRRLRLSTLPTCQGLVFGERDIHDLLHTIEQAETDAGQLSAATAGAGLLDLSAHRGSWSATAVPRPHKVWQLLACRACRGAIMIGRALRVSDMERVLRNLGGLEQPWNCPHGRPTMRHLADAGAVWRRPGPRPMPLAASRWLAAAAASPGGSS